MEIYGTAMFDLQSLKVGGENSKGIKCDGDLYIGFSKPIAGDIELVDSRASQGLLTGNRLFIDTEKSVRIQDNIESNWVLYSTEQLEIKSGKSVIVSNNSGCGSLVTSYNAGIEIEAVESVEVTENINCGSVLHGFRELDIHGGGTCDVIIECNENSGEYFAGAVIDNTSDGCLRIDHANIVSVSENVAISDLEAVGAFRSINIVLEHNNEVRFCQNRAIGQTWSGAGAALYMHSYGIGINKGQLNIVGNGQVLFDYNGVEGAEAKGGAIYMDNLKSVDILNNNEVVFERNYEENSGEYRLRGIWADHMGAVSLSAKSKGRIEFRDGVYVKATTFSLNADYTDENGVTWKQDGDVIFTGKYAEKHLNEILTAKGEDRKATEEEIVNSRTTSVKALTDLYGGRLRVEEGAIYQGWGITAHTGSAATVLVKNATLDHVGYNLTFNAGTTLAAEGVSCINGKVVMLEGSTLSLTVGTENSSNAVLSLDSAMNLQGVHLAVTGAEYLLAGKYQLIHDSAYNAADWSSDVLSITGCDDGNLAWENGVLTLTCTNAWNQAAEDGATISSIAGNLVVMGGAEIIFNGVLSADAAQQGQGHLIIDSGVAYLEQGANVEGNVVFTGTQQAERTLVAEVDTSLNCVVLATAQSESSSIEVSNGQEVELASVAGTGSLTKDGAGTLTHTGESTGVQGNLVVNEGKLLNSGTLAFDKIELNGGQLENQGTITGVEINGGILSGSGVFGGLTMKAGQLVVGNSPGFQQYTDALRAEGGELVFSVGGVAEAATSTCKGWESTVYSNIDMGGNELHLGADTTLTIAMGGSMLENLTGDFSMVLFSSVGNIDSFTDSVLAALLENTRFIVTDEEAGLREGWEAGTDLSAMLHDVEYSISGTAIVLSGQFGIVPEPATATLSLLALAGLVMRRRRC